MEYIIGFALGFVASVLKDVLQQYIFIQNNKKITDSDKLLAQLMSQGFGMNEEVNEDKDSSNIERYYKSYYS